MRVFVTGGSGFLGGHLIEGLVAAGHEVLALARSAGSAQVVRGFGATPVSGELGRVGPELLAGVEVVVHCAAYAEDWGSREQFWSANVEGTRDLLQAARAAGVRRFVHTGTEAAVFDGHDLIDIDETVPYPRPRYLYSETKAEAERLVLEANGHGIETISIRPRLIWGPRDSSVLPVVLDMARRGGFVWIDGGRQRTSTTYVGNVVHALILALDHGVPGHAVFVADDGVRTQRQVLSALAATHGVSLGDRSLPGWLMRPLAAVVEGAWRLLRLRGRPPVTRFAVDMLSASVTVRTDRARAELGYAPPVTFEEGLRRMVSGRP